MNNNMISLLPETTVSSSRIVQESVNVGQGVSAYGALAAFIDTNIAKIDELSEYIADLASQEIVKNKYNQQYFKSDTPFKSFLNRNIYLNKDKVEKMQFERYAYGFIGRAAVETALKFGARSIGKWANKKDIYNTCEQVYSVLASYISDANPKLDKKLAIIELNKIRNTFPLSVSEKRKLSLNHPPNSVTSNITDVASILNKGNEPVKNALAYYLAVLRRQIYGAETSEDKSFNNYYSLIELNGAYGKELGNENERSYDEVAADQAAYLQLSRGIMKNMFKDVPSFDIGSIVTRSNELAQYDPYTIRRKKIKGAAKGGALTIGGIITSNPEIAMNGLSTALSQFTFHNNDEVLTLAKDAMSKWGVSGNEFDVITESAEDISNKNTESDLL
ncbi:hypothetical protein [uncultured Ruminococcus sp.]|uniref:hypothetical protein n=1 Tax=uncultured Ruminococcus sp. TaxID=165186 RepID=UPI0026004AEF|nr:hypothetical protein [uncultured Ruminococcus sp.]